MALNIGIDLGTTNSAMAVYDEEADSAQMIENFDGEATTPSAVQILEDDVIVGDNALGQRVRYPDRTFTRTKPDMGTDGEDLPDQYTIDGTTYPPQRIGGYILEKMKADAEDAKGEDVNGAIVTVPYYFGEKEREATKEAARFANLNIFRVMNEPTAACFAYGYEAGEDETLLVYDLGGGTFDVTVVEVEDDKVEAKTSNGDKELGGENFDDALYEYVRQELIDQGAPDPDEDKHDQAELRKKVKEAKEMLSTRSDFGVAYRADDFYEIEVTQEKFQELTAELVDRTLDIIDELFAEGSHGYEIDDIDNVLLVGGSTRMPHVREAVEGKFDMKPATDTNPDEIVAKGAALEAATYDPDVDGGGDGGLVPTDDVLSHSLGVEAHVDDGPNTFDPILEKDTELPDRNDKAYTNPTDEMRTLICRVLEGEHDIADHDENDQLGQFLLKDVPANTTLDVEFLIKDDATLEVSAEARGNDIGNAITIEEGIGLTEEELDDIEDETQEYEPRAIDPEY